MPTNILVAYDGSESARKALLMALDLYRLAARWSEAATFPIREMQRQTREFMENELGTITAAVERPPTRPGQLQEALRELDTLSRGDPTAREGGVSPSSEPSHPGAV